VISLRRLTRGFGVELADAQSKEVLAGIKSRNEARAEQGLAGSPDTAPFLVPINMETVEQAQARSTRANAESAAAIAAQEKPPASANMLGEGIAKSTSSRASGLSLKCWSSPSRPRRQSEPLIAPAPSAAEAVRRNGPRSGRLSLFEQDLQLRFSSPGECNRPVILVPDPGCHELFLFSRHVICPTAGSHRR
jgi:hypothetical protein